MLTSKTTVWNSMNKRIAPYVQKDWPLKESQKFQPTLTTSSSVHLLLKWVKVNRLCVGHLHAEQPTFLVPPTTEKRSSPKKNEKKKESKEKNIKRNWSDPHHSWRSTKASNHNCQPPTSSPNNWHSTLKVAMKALLLQLSQFHIRLKEKNDTDF